MVVNPLTLKVQLNHTHEFDRAVDTRVRKKRFLLFLFGVKASVSAVRSTANTAYTVSQLNDIRLKLQLISQHVSELSEVSAKLDQLVDITKDTDSLYEYTHKIFEKFRTI